MIARERKSPLQPLIASLQKWQNALWLALAIALVWWAASGLETHRTNWSDTGKQTMAIFGLMVTTFDVAFAPELSWKLIETVEMAILGTLLASLLAVPFGFLAAKNITKGLNGTGKFLLNGIRTFPEIILAIIFIRGVGPGPLAGIMAMGIHSIGMLGKLYAEAVESIDKGPVEALTSTGASRIQQIWFAVIPQVLPEFASFALYRLEINARAATILGVVGAGGIGTALIFAVHHRDWGRVAIILVGIIVVVTAIDLISGWLRKKLV